MGGGRARQVKLLLQFDARFLLGGFPRSRTDFIKSIAVRLKGWGQGGLLALPALLLPPDISCSKSIAVPGSFCCMLHFFHALLPVCLCANSACCSALQASALLPACYVANFAMLQILYLQSSALWSYADRTCYPGTCRTGASRL